MTIPQTERGVGFDDLRRTGGPSSHPGPTQTQPKPPPAARHDPAISSSIRDRARAQLAAAGGRLTDAPVPNEAPDEGPDEGQPDEQVIYQATDEQGAGEQGVDGPEDVAVNDDRADDDQVDDDQVDHGGINAVGATDVVPGPADLAVVCTDLPVLGDELVVSHGRAVTRGYDIDLAPSEVLPPTRSTQGWRALLGLGPSPAESRDLALKRAMNVNFGRPVNIVLANPRGYAGKTSLTLGLAGALGRARAGGVCAFEDHELRGTMALRVLNNGTTRTIRNFIDDLSSLTPAQVRHADLHRYLRHQDSGQFDAMVTSSEEEEQLTGDEFRAGLELLARFYQAIVVDTANNEAHEAFRAAVESATVLVVPIKWRRTHVRPAIQMLKDMATRSAHHERLVRNAVIVASHAGGELIVDDRNEWLSFFTERAHSVIEIGTDLHISADRPIVHDQLARATQISLDRLGAAVCSAAMTNIKEEEEDV